MNGFDAVLLPDAVAAGLRRETRFHTDIISTAAGAETRNASHAFARHHYVLEPGPLPLAAAQELEAFFIARRGRHRGFLVRDWMQPHSGDGAAPKADNIGLTSADKTRRLFQIAMPGRRAIRPLMDGFLLARNGRRLKAGNDFTLDQDAATVRLSRALSSSATLTAGFYFSVPVRFDADQLDMERVSDALIRVGALSLVEIDRPLAAA